VTWGFPVTVFLAALVYGNFGQAFCAPGVVLTAGDGEGVQRGAGGGVGRGGERVQ